MSKIYTLSKKLVTFPLNDIRSSNAQNLSQFHIQFFHKYRLSLVNNIPPSLLMLQNDNIRQLIFSNNNYGGEVFNIIKISICMEHMFEFNKCICGNLEYSLYCRKYFGILQSLINSNNFTIQFGIVTLLFKTNQCVLNNHKFHNNNNKCEMCIPLTLLLKNVVCIIQNDLHVCYNLYMERGNYENLRNGIDKAINLIIKFCELFDGEFTKIFVYTYFEMCLYRYSGVKYILIEYIANNKHNDFKTMCRYNFFDKMATYQNYLLKPKNKNMFPSNMDIKKHSNFIGLIISSYSKITNSKNKIVDQINIENLSLILVLRYGISINFPNELIFEIFDILYKSRLTESVYHTLTEMDN